jgi:hypothetical protein
MFYKPLNLDNQELIIKQLQTYFHNLLEKKDGNWGEMINFDTLSSISPELIDNLTRLNCVFDVSRVLVTMPNDKLGVHIDGSPQYPKNTAINIPIFNTKNSLMKWFKLNDESALRYGDDPRYQNFWYVPRELVPNVTEQVDQLELLTPHLVKINTPHTVENYNETENRVIISIRCRPEPLHLWDN